MKKITLAFLLSVAALYCNAQWISGGTRISNSNDNHHRAFVSAAAHGSYYVAWEATDTTKNALSKVKIAGYDSNGVLLIGWTVGGDTTTHDKGDYYGAQLLTSEDNGVIVSWYGYPAGSNRSHIYAQKYDIHGVPLWNGGFPVQVSTGTSFVDEYPMIITDTKNGFFVSWTRFDSVIDASPAYIYLQHIDSLGHVATGWNANATGVATTPGQRQYYPKIALTPDLSSVYVLYNEGLVGSTELLLNKYNASNGVLAAGWSSSPVVVSPGPDVYPEINHDMALYTDNSNDALAVWVESRYTGNGEIYMQQVSPTGVAMLATDGEFLFGDTTGAANGIDYVEVIQEADKSLLIAYNNLVNFNDVAAMKVKPNGTILWNDSLITTGGYSAYPYPALDGNGGVYLFYVNTNSPEKLYALAIDSAGKMYKGWSLPGSLFGGLGDYDGFNPNYDVNAVASTNKTEAIVAWNRTTGALFAEFTCNLLSNGTNCQSPDAIDEIAKPNEEYTVYPNPSNGVFIVKSLPGGQTGGKLKVESSVEIYNLLGEKIQSFTINHSSFTIDMQASPAGMYFISIRDMVTGEMHTLKLVKE